MSIAFESSKIEIFTVKGFPPTQEDDEDNKEVSLDVILSLGFVQTIKEEVESASWSYDDKGAEEEEKAAVRFLK